MRKVHKVFKGFMESKVKAGHRAFKDLQVIELTVNSFIFKGFQNIFTNIFILITYTGMTGPQGLPGIRGPKGSIGDTGAVGAVGSVGQKGEPGMLEIKTLKSR